MRARSGTAVIVQRVVLVAIVGVVVAISLSSSWFAGLVAMVTIGAVLIDMWTYARARASHESPPADPTATPRAITIDLSRRP